ncbi:hypothetical protein C8C83_5549 [Flavobacterium sp. 90]|uniref:hypothetical protein n=1 Tax=unclassified Flavobacterium TaxID=196869 RepID=UPI000EB1B373|nr:MULTISPECIES: hypothetical protein [unclassified Flavobacterium]RKR08312.1 hypothetical protein C8C82_0180 [Flavobacterium sp. 81]TCK57499.1 hypothetical protein C8C83_5549 [Flavobacterium sp. 90]
MKTLKCNKITVIIMAILFVTISTMSCSTHTHTPTAGNSGKIPPGQAKKMSGSKSAKAYAPGQQKKK